MTPHPFGDDTVYTAHRIEDAAWPMGWDQSGERGQGKSHNKLFFVWREYIISNIVCVLLIAALIISAIGRVARQHRHAFVWRINVIIKRTFDICASILGLLLAAPVFLLLPILIKLDSPGPVFFRQLRVGVNRRKGDRRRTDVRSSIERRNNDRRKQDSHGRPFAIIKFRSMVQDAERKCGPVWATDNDPRITRLGAFIRKTRLDELPQLFNVLRGEMSLVGPRPERPFFVEQLSQEVPGFLDRLSVTPGITGLAQIKNGYDTSVEAVHHKVRYDLSYIRGWTPLKDFKILFATIMVVLTGRGAC